MLSVKLKKLENRKQAWLNIPSSYHTGQAGDMQMGGM